MLGERIAKAREEAGYTNQKSLASVIKVGARTLADYENNNSEPKASTIKLIAETCKISYEWLLDGEEELLDVPVFLRKEIGTKSSSPKIEIPFYPDTYAAAGYGADNILTTDSGVMSFDQDFLRMQLGISSFSGLHIITAVGDSMIKTFSSGELLFVLPFQSEDNTIRDDAIYVFQTPNGTMVKRIEVHPIKKYYILHSDNDKIKPIKIEGDEIDSCTIVGRVVAHFDRV